MSKKKKLIDTSVVKKIEVDEKTKKAVVVEVPEEEYLNQPIQKADFVEEKYGKKKLKDAVVEKTLGIKKEDIQNIDDRQKVFKIVITTLFVVFVLGVLAYTAYKDFFINDNFPSLSQLKSIFKSGIWFFLLGIASFFLAYFFKGLKSVFMCKAMTGKSHFMTCMETGIIGTYYNNVTPLAVGGQPFEIYHLSKHGVHGGVASSIPIASFFLNQFAFVVLGIISLFLFTNNTYNAPLTLINAFPPVFYVLTIVGLCCCMFVPLMVVLFSMLPRVGARLVYFVIKLGTKLRIIKEPEKTLQSTIKTVVHNSHCLKKIAVKPFLFITLLVFSFLENIANVSIAFFVLKGFGLNLGLPFMQEWLIIASICFILYASITFIPTPGNSGAADLSFFILFESVLFAGLAFPAMMVWRLFSFYSTIILGFLFVILKKRADKKSAKLNNTTQSPPVKEQLPEQVEQIAQELIEKQTEKEE